eukprot:TRINITY_DN57478_c0_g1_i1.p1 TRINITY_DN57478_c0_g1~~TRINITY_DN57478_c0_g1_i1.p1  ORF type:complete len:1152 (+),score=237.22 TRINITY_DN57478_c0_g1_i1:129-3584(+)
MADRGSNRGGKPAPPAKIGQYLVGNIIGKGGFGSVYKALDQQRAHFVAIKQVSHGGLGTGDISSIEIEISLMSKLKHRNIVKYIDSIRTDTHLNIVLEFIEGGSLSSIIKKFGAFPESLCAIYTHQILKGLKYLHSQGVIHRDIKGANVLTTKTGIIKLADFGVATKLSEIDSSKRRVVGTPYWMAPETVEMSPPTPASDIWSVGSTVVEMVTEKPPYADLPQMSALYRIVSDPHPPMPAGFTKSLEHFLFQCFEKNPVNRAGAARLLEDDWIQSNRRLTLGFTRQMLSPKGSQMPESKKVTDVPIDEEEKESDQESDAEEDQGITTLIGSMSGGDASALLQEASGTHAAGLAAVVGAAATVAKELSDEEVVLLPAPRRPSKSSRTPNSKPSDQDGTPSPGGTPVGFEPESFPADGALPAVDGGRAINSEDSMKAADVQRNLTEQGYHFAFLDYYHQYFESGLHSKPKVAEETTISKEEGKPAADTTSLADGSKSLSFRGNVARFKQLNGGDATPMPPPPRVRGSNSQKDPVLACGGAGDRDRQRVAAEIKSLLASIKPFEEPGVLVGVCKRLTELLEQGGDKEGVQHLVMQHGAVPIIEMLQITDETLLRSVLKVVNQIVEGHQGFQELFSMVGLIPGVIKFARPHFKRPLRHEAATFISRLCNSSSSSLQMLIACGGLEAIVDLVAHDYYHNRDLVWLALDAVNTILKMPGSHSRDLCRILAKHGLCCHMCLLIDTLASEILDRAAHYLQVVVSLLLFFAKTGDAVVKVYMAKAPVLEGLISSLDFLQTNLAAQVCKIFKYLAQEPAVLNMMENAGIVAVLAVHMSVQNDDPGTVGSVISADQAQPQDACSQCLLALSNLCKLSRPRQEQAALAGAIPKLQQLVEKQHPLREHAFVMLCDMTCSSLATRRLLWTQGGVEFMVRSLTMPDLQIAALEALVGWFGVKEHRANWCERLESMLLKGPDFLIRLLSLFRSTQEGVFLKTLDPLLKLVRISEQTNTALAASHEFFQELVHRLKSGSAEQSEVRFSDPRQIRLASRFHSEDNLNDADFVTRAPTNGVRRLVSAQPVTSHLSHSDDAVRARQSLLRLLLQLCQPLSHEQLNLLVQRYRLTSLVHHVLLEERRKQRVILCEIATQLMNMFHKASPADS